MLALSIDLESGVVLNRDGRPLGAVLVLRDPERRARRVQLVIDLPRELGVSRLSVEGTRFYLEGTAGDREAIVEAVMRRQGVRVDG